MRRTHRMMLGWLAGGLLLIAATGCGFPTQTTFGVSGDGGLRTIVIPDDAEVFVDGASMGPASQYRGRTFIQMKAGKHVVEIKKAGYATYREEVFVSGNLKTITVTLKKSE
ncbi:MAG: PEGA domain-containing protein [Nitrospirota bacterium]